MYANEGVLGDFFGIRVIMKLGEHDAINPPPVPPHDLGEGGFISLLKTFHEAKLVNGLHP
jgi:hypothetical protein